jgi:trimeric autotransporter adhesin
MKFKLSFLLVLCLVANRIDAAPLGTAFSYQGFLSAVGSPANGKVDFQFSLYDAASNGNLAGPVLTNTGVTVNNGLFLVTLDFGDVFGDNSLWLAIGVRTNGSSGAFTALTPLQSMAPTPYALYATNAGAATNVGGSSVTAAQLNTPEGSPASGQVLGYNGTNLIWVTGGGGGSGSWSLTGNAGTSPASGNFIGTTDDNPLELHVNGVRALRLMPSSDAPNVIGGAPGNFVASGIIGSTIGGGGTITLYGRAYPNSIFADNGTIGGGLGNTIQANAIESTIAGGIANSIYAPNCAISGGNGNLIKSGAGSSFIGGGQTNEIDADSFDSLIGAGFENYIASITCTIAGGSDNTIGTNSFNSSIGGGFMNSINTPNCAISGGNGNEINSGSGSSFIGGGQTNEIDSDSFDSLIGGGFENYIASITCTIAGGNENFIGSNSFDSTIGGGSLNSVFAFGSTSSSATYATVGGGFLNGTGNDYATVPGGSNNQASGIASFAAGASALAGDDHSFVWGDGSRQAQSQGANTFTVLATGGIYCYSGSGGAYLAPGQSAWTSISDRNKKKNFKPVDCQAVLEKLMSVPIQQWNYKWESDTNTPNIGPMAQDFKPAFYPGRDDKGITTLEFDGVELAAIQGLNQKLEERDKHLEAALREKDAKIARLENELAEVKSAQHQNTEQWEARFETLQKALDRVADNQPSPLAAASAGHGPK